LHAWLLCPLHHTPQSGYTYSWILSKRFNYVRLVNSAEWTCKQTKVRACQLSSNLCCCGHQIVGYLPGLIFQTDRSLALVQQCLESACKSSHNSREQAPVSSVPGRTMERTAGPARRPRMRAQLVVLACLAALRSVHSANVTLARSSGCCWLLFPHAARRLGRRAAVLQCGVQTGHPNACAPARAGAWLSRIWQDVRAECLRQHCSRRCRYSPGQRRAPPAGRGASPPDAGADAHRQHRQPDCAGRRASVHRRGLQRWAGGHIWPQAAADADRPGGRLCVRTSSLSAHRLT